MASSTEEKTGIFNMQNLSGGKPCPDCDGVGQLRFDSEDINEKFEVEKQTVITECARCHGTGHVPAG